ncbi:MAG TPA: hypothetical protein VGI93_20050 [Steroidobacteraceae bacterium]|jgi:hypothetical protein
MHPLTCIALLWTLTCLTARGLFDSGISWKSGRFQLLWIDLGDGGSIGLVDYTVYAGGSDADHIVIKQQRGEEKSITNFHIVDRNSHALPLHPERALTRPLTQGQFEETSKLTALPRFTTVLETLQ